ncbi:molybdate ABC transporter substrate-binding protein [Balneatrix alpica]|uniref:Molybdate ABC transporter substrate-binding protein n=1 Tax=Balneatrix alpica TaxID=75684 RepID=A0ABV5ZDL5_9GAMM|nr:molybdate ABC transporter substrate-binding protein [Balneatrix alpica]
MRLLLLLVLLPYSLLAQASNFKLGIGHDLEPIMASLIAQFEPEAGHSITLVSAPGSTLEQQAKAGELDMLLAPDARVPSLLESQGLIRSGSRQTYAIGQLWLWTPRTSHPQPGTLQQLSSLAMVNPKLDAYGRAGQNLLQSLSRWPWQRGQLLQTFDSPTAKRMAASGQVEGALLPASLLLLQGIPLNQVLIIPPGYYQPLEQQLVILKASSQQALAERLSAYLRSEPVQRQLADFGYLQP